MTVNIMDHKTYLIRSEPMLGIEKFQKSRLPLFRTEFLAYIIIKIWGPPYRNVGFNTLDHSSRVHPWDHFKPYLIHFELIVL